LACLAREECGHTQGLLSFVVALLTDHKDRGRHEDTEGEHDHQTARPDEDGSLQFQMTTRVTHATSADVQSLRLDLDFGGGSAPFGEYHVGKLPRKSDESLHPSGVRPPESVMYQSG
jgi:hypothetical protein